MSKENFLSAFFLFIVLILCLTLCFADSTVQVAIITRIISLKPSFFTFLEIIGAYSSRNKTALESNLCPLSLLRRIADICTACDQGNGPPLPTDVPTSSHQETLDHTLYVKMHNERWMCFTLLQGNVLHLIKSASPSSTLSRSPSATTLSQIQSKQSLSFIMPSFATL
jgi:hypothetical protein